MKTELWRDEAPLRLGISTCLLGEQVRWDGGHKRDRFLTDLLAGSGTDHGGFHAVVAGRTDRLLGSYGHWTTTVRSSRTGVLLCPEILDGDLFALQLPPRTELPPLPGRGWLVTAGSRQVCQVAHAPRAALAIGDRPLHTSRCTRSS